MKKTLNDIFVLKDKIVKLINDFGYNENIRIFFESRENKTEADLHFIVEEAHLDKISSYTNSEHLAAKLIQLLNCQILITVQQGIENLYKYDFKKKSVPFDKEEVKKFLNKDSLDAYSYKLPIEEEDDLQLSFKLADEYLQENFNEKKDDKKRKISYMFPENTIANQCKKSRLEINESNHVIALMMPLPENFNFNQDILTNNQLAEEVASFYFEKIKSLTPEASKV